MNFIVSVCLVLSVSFSALPPCCSCLPGGIKETDPVSYLSVKPGIRKGKQYTTVREKLVELKARCKKGKLLDGKGREIRFFHLTGCWGNPPAGYQEILNKQAQELASLKKRYTVIEMTCNPSGEPIP